MRFSYRRLITGIAMLAMLLRILVPTGFMPGSLASGWYIVLCPDGIPSSTMMVLMDEHSHHHMQPKGTNTLADDEYKQCDLGSGFISAALFQPAELALGVFLLLLAIWQVTSFTLQKRARQYLARAPPQPLRY